ncbi:hypothetical protein [Phytoactinopolyspora limicola]|uniref:hypothetical protein n=1 Tax=Phytoactinopolyspora limicola TaxID=2715536 RepID=UPI00140CE762|nr:hypothetical protein [Phytoactinopolyspora limicola]
MMGRAVRLAATAAVAGAATWALTRRWTRQPPELFAAPAGPDRPADPADVWRRKNFHGETVSLAAGPALAVGAAAGIAAAPGLRAGTRLAGIGAALGVGAVGLYDDLAGSSSSKGLRGHLSALRDGEVTSGSVKIGVIGLTGLVGSALVSDNLTDAVIGGAAVAGHANVLNLLDLRPGRAGKAALMHAPLVFTGPAAPVGAAALGAMAAALPDDLGERTMLGDAGANTLGALLGLALVAREGRRARLAHLVVVTALTLASEKVSFTEVIEKTPVLRDLDLLGRRR